MATRIVDFTNPVADIDAQFYLLTGQSMLAGKLPYVDIWDRKPPGLFLLYEGLAALGSGRVLVVHLVATLFASATATLIYVAARRHASSRGALLAALAYLLMLPLFGGQGGQSPVFYNLFMAAAALLTMRAAADAKFVRVKHAFATMLLCGIALTIKQTSLFEGVFLGLVWLALLARQGMRPGRLLLAVVAMAGLALLPTLLCFEGFALARPDAPAAMLDAAYLSIFRKSGPSAAMRVDQLLYLAVTLGPLALIAVLGIFRRWSEDRRGALFLLGWIGAAVAGYASVPALFVHYALPLIVPLSIAAAPIFARPRSGVMLFAFVLVLAVSRGQMTDFAAGRQSRASYAATVRMVDQARHGGCLFLADGPALLYASTRACQVTRYLFPAHLTYAVEQGAIGVDQAAELARVLALRPAVITTQDSARINHGRRPQAMLDATLQRDYRLVLSLGKQPASTLDGLRLWQRRDLPPPLR